MGFFKEAAGIEFLSLAKSFLKTKDTANTKPSSTSKTNATAVETMKATLKHTEEWSTVVELFESDEFVLPNTFSQDYAKCFLLLGGEIQSKKKEFGLALCRILAFVKLSRAQDFLLHNYSYFFESF